MKNKKLSLEELQDIGQERSRELTRKLSIACRKEIVEVQKMKLDNLQTGELLMNIIANSFGASRAILYTALALSYANDEDQRELIEQLEKGEKNVFDEMVDDNLKLKEQMKEEFKAEMERKKEEAVGKAG